MTLLGKIIQDEEPNFPGHVFEAIVIRWFQGDYTRARCISELEDALEDGSTLTPTETDALDEMFGFYDGLNGTGKRDYRIDLHSKVILVQFGHITRNAFRTEVGIISET